MSAASCWLSASSASPSPVSFALTRPPGHHATRSAAMGFCLVNYAACAALHLLGPGGGGPVGLIDIDVHFGNGSADILKGVEGARYASVHQGGIYPGSGETEPEGDNVMKLPVPAGTQGEEWLRAVGECLDFVTAHRPEALVVSVGYDGLAEDKLASLELTAEDYADALAMCVARMDGKKVVIGLEGGYDLEATGEAVRIGVERIIAMENK